MRRVLTPLATASLASVLIAAPAQAAPTKWLLTSPNGNGVAATIILDQGRLSLSVSHGRTVVLQPSALGLRTSTADLTSGLVFEGEARHRITEHYKTVTGRQREHHADAAETTLRFTKAGQRLDLVVRVSADGLGYRYVLPGTGPVTITGEASEYAVPTGARAILLPYNNRSDYESIHRHSTVADAQAGPYGYPSLFKVDDTWMLVSESNMSGAYGATRLTLDADRRFKVTFPDAGGSVTTAPFTSPWRTLITGDLATVVASDLGTDLAEPSRIADTSWIKPGVSAWSWWGDGTGNLELQKKYADYAAKQGWEYILVDSGWINWQPGQVQELIGYGKARKVGVQLWVRWTDVDTDEERRAKLPLWREWGAAGLKIDFMDSDSQERMRFYDAILEATARNKLLVNFHGATIPRGIERTWPHVMTLEGVRGAEGIKPKPDRKPFPLAHYTTLPFTRNLAGSMDFTPVTFSAVRDNSDAAELALAVVFESGIQNFADKITNYAKIPLAERFLRTVPTVWDRTELLSGDPGDHAVLARRHGNEWFVGGISASAARTMDVPLRFLGPGRWKAEIYSDTADRTIAASTRAVTARDVLAQPVARGGGFAIRFSRE
ncbi:glycoside hydrolase family 97 protein [Allokutzneria sp. A3M-2-11 16]|uniref:glycoside hydrolase family 97 protein n=1 Tax=Allokutzneria sp. A3M-2-11 16 TaxID=2962043 RepID=UPI0020B821C4|nr:glycoside hydrolase family 97 protein [Allokutzneria sp. A3M-2-11 16]MCP3801639.1 glycoside hydrolase family 97 protein [Allokutzneria sp. A3M-2-11 16]